MTSGRETSPPVASRATQLTLAGVITVASIGYAVGIWRNGIERQPAERLPSVTPAAEDVVAALSYADLRTTDIGPNREWRSNLRDLARPAPVTRIESPSPADKVASLQVRSSRRAYNGAPPVIPHPADQLSSEACLICHGEGLQVANRPADRLPHPYLANCQQCHAVEVSPAFKPFVLAANTFEGLPAPFEGPRAWPGAPPIIPHSTWMRDECLSCHGPHGKPGLRTTHPERTSCLQCHAPSAELDQNIVSSGPWFISGAAVEMP